MQSIFASKKTYEKNECGSRPGARVRIGQVMWIDIRPVDEAVMLVVMLVVMLGDGECGRHPSHILVESYPVTQETFWVAAVYS